MLLEHDSVNDFIDLLTQNNDKENDCDYYQNNNIHSNRSSRSSHVDDVNDLINVNNNTNNNNNDDQSELTWECAYCTYMNKTTDISKMTTSKSSAVKVICKMCM